MVSEFREFISRGNVIDLAVAVVIGAAFNAIVTSLVEDIVTPALLNPAMQAARVEELARLSYNGIKYGNFLAAVLHFLIIAFVMFLLVRTMNRIIKKREEKTPAPLAEVALLTEIRDLLKQQQP